MIEIDLIFFIVVNFTSFFKCFFVINYKEMEGEYRGCHSDLVHHSEEIAFFQGQKWEKDRIHASFDVKTL